MMGNQRQRPSVTVDVVVLAPPPSRPGTGGGWRVLLIRRKRPPFEGEWALPGGFVEPGETLVEAARRELWEETGLRPVHMQQLRAFGQPGRDPRGWVISIAHLTLLDAEEASARQPQAASDAVEVAWFGLEHLPPLAFDHGQILFYARQALRDST
jgi:8-oxo-dGTP diphosphatase